MNFTIAKQFIKRWVLTQKRFQARVNPSAPVIIVGMFQTGNGIGRAAVGAYENFRRLGHEVFAVDVSGAFDQIDAPSPVPLSQISVLKKQLNSIPTIIMYVNAPETIAALWYLKLMFWCRWPVISAWAWELKEVPKQWKKEERHLSRIWVPSKFVKSAVEAIKLSVGIQVVPHFIQIQKPTFNKVGNEVPFCIMCIGDGHSSLERKNLKDAIRIFKQAFPVREGLQVSMVLKTRNLSFSNEYAKEILDAVEEDERITVYDITLDYDSYIELLSDADVVLSAHRSEGYGIHLYEALMLGKCVVATGWSGNLDFMNSGNSIIVDCIQIPVVDETRVYENDSTTSWAQIDIEYASTSLQGLYHNKALRDRLSANALEDAHKAMKCLDLHKFL